jgi:rhodanese-related sulfurtransferase
MPIARILLVNFLVILIALLAATAIAEEPDPQQAPSVTAAELKKQVDSGRGPIVIDVRTKEEYASGHVPGAVNIPFDEVASRIDELDAPHGVALYCMVGPRARKGETALLAVGYKSVFHLEGGLAAWKAAGFPVEDTR